VKSRIIEKKDRVRDDFELGFGTEFLVDDRTCAAQRVVLGYTIMPPSSRNQAHIHTNCEVVWHLIEGHTVHMSGSEEAGNFKETECRSGVFGYVNAGDIHVGVNLSDTDKGEVVFAYAGVNSRDRAGTEWTDAPEIVIRHLADRGIALDDLDLDM
jgi:uncharacterized RmlC-like cupin family protein